jgi:hypothetical protein
LDQLTEHAGQVIRVRTPRPGQLAAILVENGATAHVVGPDRLEASGASGELAFSDICSGTKAIYVV